MYQEEINRLLGMVLNMESLFTCVYKEEDADTKQVHFWFLKLLRKHFMKRKTCG
jgi:histone acetyltransferase